MTGILAFAAGFFGTFIGYGIGWCIAATINRLFFQDRNL